MDMDETRSWYSANNEDNNNWRETVDPDVLEVVELLNALSGVATITSCAGHGMSVYHKREHKEGEEPYLFMVCRNLASQFVILKAIHLAMGCDKLEFQHKRHHGAIEGPTLSISFDSYDNLTAFHDNLIHEIEEMKWKKSDDIRRGKLVAKIKKENDRL